jgi:hypothetical protein
MIRFGNAFDRERPVRSFSYLEYTCRFIKRRLSPGQFEYARPGRYGSNGVNTRAGMVPAELNAWPGPPHFRAWHVDVFEPDARLDESLDAQVFYRKF